MPNIKQDPVVAAAIRAGHVAAISARPFITKGEFCFLMGMHPADYRHFILKIAEEDHPPFHKMAGSHIIATDVALKWIDNFKNPKPPVDPLAEFAKAQGLPVMERK